MGPDLDEILVAAARGHLVLACPIPVLPRRAQVTGCEDHVQLSLACVVASWVWYKRTAGT